MRQIVLDTETTGLEPKEGHRIIEIGCVEMLNREFTGNNLHIYFNPEREVEEGALKVHGISNAFLQDKPLFADQVEAIIDYLTGAELVIHNAPFDVGFLNHEFRLAQKKLKNIEAYCSVLDTLKLARKMHPGQRNSLDALCKRYQIDNTHRQLHGALLDAEILARVYLAMTGGQTSLFSSDASHNKKQQDVQVKTATLQQKPLPILKANTDELNQHQQYLKELAKSDSGCVWQES